MKQKRLSIFIAIGACLALLTGTLLYSTDLVLGQSESEIQDSGSVQAAALGTSFTYQGRLNDGGAPADGDYDLRFILYDAEIGGSQVGGILTIENVNVANGLFTVELDFGSTAFAGEARWLEVAARVSGGSVFTPLAPRQALTPTPYALHKPVHWCSARTHCKQRSALGRPGVEVGRGSVGAGNR